MICDVYEMSKNKSCFLIIPENESIPKLAPEILDKMGILSFFKKIEISRNRPYIAVDANKIFDDIDEKGFNISCFEVRFNL
ncbi:MAG: YcgL domain-containing protein [Candidatus Thorarchaeota archaeon]